MKYICVVILLFAALATVRGYGYNNDQQFAQQFVNQHLGCILNRSPCSSTGRKIKEMLPYAIDGGCTLCNTKQRAMVGQVVRYMKRYHPYEWNRIVQIYG